MKASLARRQKGAAAIEFVAVFMVFFAVFYGLVSYALPMLMVQSFNQAASEAVRRCVALEPDSAAASYNTVAQQAIDQQLAWMPAALGFSAVKDAKVELSGKLLTVTIQYPRERLTRVLPVLVLPVIGEVPHLPEQLQAKASLQL